MNSDDERHGQPAGYDAHRRANQKACDPCKEAAAKYEYDRRIGRILGRTRTVPGIGPARRIQALVALGYCYSDLATELGWAHDGPRKITRQSDSVMRRSTADRVAAVYERLSMTPPPRATGAERRRAAIAKATAARYGWHPPLSWDNIDDPNEQPRDPGYQARNLKNVYDRGEHDEAVVIRILAGDYHLPATTTERAAVVARWTGARNELERATGWRIDRYLEREPA